MLSRNPAAAIRSGLAALVVFLFSSAFASAASPATEAEIREATAQKFVVQALHNWQDRLNLKNWDIRVDLVHPNQLEPKTLGSIHWDANTMKATIDVLSSYDYTLATPQMLDDMEFTVVHELVHLELSSLPKSQASRRQEEYAVNQLTRALLDLAKR